MRLNFLVLIYFLLLIAGGAARADDLEQAITAHIGDVAEFKVIREEARRLGVRVWLFGGTAAGYAHYVRWDMRRGAGDVRFQKERFDYDFTNIYRSTQDLDVVVDGPPDKAIQLQHFLQERFPYLAGSKTAWEVRLLRQTVGGKDALLDNPEFSNQHTDSNSTGMIELTPPPGSEHVVRDLRDWHAAKPQFLEDVREGRLHYYFSEKHDQTKRAMEGLNPPILSAIRYLTKAFQYELEIRPEDWERIRKVIDAFDPDARMNRYVRDWIEKNGKKLYQHAVSLEFARKKLDDLKLREKLMAMGNPRTQDSLSWWMSKQPLESKKVGEGPGATAASYGISEVAHETSTFLAYESITRSHKGEPNVFISRNGVNGETAAHGDGFYTRMGRVGARGTGLTIRFRVDPNAREGTDFTKLGDFIIFGTAMRCR